MSDPSATPVGSTFMTSSPPPHSNQEAVNPFPEETSFEEGQIVMLSIPAKLRQSTKSAKLPCRVTGKVNKAYTLTTQWGQIKGLHQASQIASNGSSHYWEERIPKEATPGYLVTLAEAVYGQNNRRDILDGLVEDEIQLAGANEEEQQVRKSTRVTRKMRKLL